MPQPVTYVATFDRVGRKHPEPFEGKAPITDQTAMEAEILRYAKRFLASRGVDIEVDPTGTGAIYAGGRNAGEFTWAAKS
jgi:hypothetical protein